MSLSMDGRKYYWFEDRRIPLREVQPGEVRPSPYPALDATQFMQGIPPVLGTAPVFCFFSSADGAWEWLEYQLRHTLALRSVLVLQGTGDTDYLLEVCDEAINSQAISFDGFLINPPANLGAAPLRRSREQVKAALRSQRV
jgi:hypothetical protein